jgi:hypothetical protein
MHKEEQRFVIKSFWTKSWGCVNVNDLTFEDVQSIFYDWMRRLAWVIEYEGEYILE